MKVVIWELKGENASMENINIIISYYRNDYSREEVIQISPEEYFDIDESPYDIDSIPKYNHAIDYISDSINVIKTFLRIENTTSHREKSIETYYWANQSSSVIIIREYNQKELIYNEIIYSIKLPKEASEKGEIYNISRFLVSGNIIKCLYQGVFIEDEHGETELRII